VGTVFTTAEGSDITSLAVAIGKRLEDVLDRLWGAVLTFVLPKSGSVTGPV
jgi:tRNA A37 threonylcarbamoyladenosine synthetase subunit TsaC/SUA5/YrdC